MDQKIIEEIVSEILMNLPSERFSFQGLGIKVIA